MDFILLILSAQNLNSLGLLMDIFGAILLWRYGLPPDVRRDGKFFLAINGGDENEKLKAKKYDSYSKCALYLLIIGFLLQLLSNFV